MPVFLSSCMCKSVPETGAEPSAQLLSTDQFPDAAVKVSSAAQAGDAVAQFQLGWLILHPEAEFDGVTQEAVIGQVLLDIVPPSRREVV